MRVCFVNRYFHPDHSATSQIASDLAFHLASKGWDVEAICSRQRYDDPAAQLPKHESFRGVRITRIATTRFGRSFLPGRAIDYLTFYLNAFLAIRKRRDAVIVAMTDPPLLSVIAAMASRRVVNWVQDLFPEVAEALGMRFLRVLRPIRDWSLRKAKKNVVLGDLMAQRVPSAQIIHNWALSGPPPPPAALGGAPPPPAALSGAPPPSAALGGAPPPSAASGAAEGRGAPRSVGYSGNLGRAHEVDTTLAAMRMLPDVRFVFIGGGAQLERVKREAPPNAEFRPYAPRERLAESLSSVDAHLVSLQPSLEGLIVPSKFYGVLAVGRPVIFIGSRTGELAKIIEECRCGAAVEPGDAEGLARAIRSIDAEMGARGRAVYVERFAPERAFEAWERVLQEAAS